MDQQSADPNLLKNKHECRNTQSNTQVKWRLPNKARLLTLGSEWPRSPPEYTPCTLKLAQIHKHTPAPAELKTFIWQHQLTPDTHTVLPWPCSTPGLIKIVAGIRGVATTGRQSHSFCALPVCFSLYVCVCVYVLSGGRDESETEGGEVRGDTHPLNPPLLTCEQRDGAERSTANWINWSITSHLSGGMETPLKEKHGGPTWTMQEGSLIKSHRAASFYSARFSSFHDVHVCWVLLLNNTGAESWERVRRCN